MNIKIPVGKEHLSVEVTGEGSPILLWHSLLCDRRMWQNQVPLLSQHYQVINLEMRGHGKSSRFSFPYDYWELSRDVGRVLDYLKIDSVVIIGLSMGGMAAYHVALDAPERLSGMIAIAASAQPDPPLQRFRNWTLSEVALRVNPKRLSPVIDPLMLGKTTLQNQKNVVSQWHDQFQDINPQGIYFAVKTLGKRDNLLPILPQINPIPTLIMVGEEDITFAGKHTQQVAEVLPHAEFKSIPQAGHLCVLEQPQLINEAVLNFLQQIPGYGRNS